MIRNWLITEFELIRIWIRLFPINKNIAMINAICVCWFAHWFLLRSSLSNLKIFDLGNSWDQTSTGTFMTGLPDGQISIEKPPEPQELIGTRRKIRYLLGQGFREHSHRSLVGISPGGIKLEAELWLHPGLWTLIGKSWETHPDFFLEFSFSGSSHRPFYWKTDPFEFFVWNQIWYITYII